MIPCCIRYSACKKRRQICVKPISSAPASGTRFRQHRTKFIPCCPYTPSLYNKAFEIASTSRKICALSNNQPFDFRAFATLFIKCDDYAVQKAGIAAFCKACRIVETEPIHCRLHRNAQNRFLRSGHAHVGDIAGMFGQNGFRQFR